MRADIYPLQLLLLTVSGWVNCHHQEVIEYLVEENRVARVGRVDRCNRVGLQPSAGPLSSAQNG